MALGYKIPEARYAQKRDLPTSAPTSALLCNRSHPVLDRCFVTTSCVLECSLLLSLDLLPDPPHDRGRQYICDSCKPVLDLRSPKDEFSLRTNAYHAMIPFSPVACDVLHERWISSRKAPKDFKEPHDFRSSRIRRCRRRYD